MSTKKFGILIICMLFLAAFLIGCGSSGKEGGSSASVGEVGDTACFQCHAATADPLTGDTFIEQYQRSTHSELGCESCHGGGAQHNGVGPFPYTLNSGVTDAKKAERCDDCHNGTTVFKGKVAPLSSSPNFQNGNHANPFSAEEAHEAKCSRCHSHEGAVIQGTAGFTGEKAIMDNTAYQPVLARDPETFNTIKCGTCHEHGGNLRQWTTRDANGNIVAWDPNKNFVNDQIDLCTGCHTMNTMSGTLIGSGNTLSITANDGTAVAVPTAAFYHNTRWFRTLTSTHYDQPATAAVSSGGVIEGYVIRRVNEVKNPCFDCHGHEYKTNTRALADRPERGSTTFTDWGQSAHAGKLLSQKVAAAAGLSGTAQVDAVMKAGVVEATGAAWIHYNWDNSTGKPSSDPDPDRKSCQRCHTSTGVSNFLSNPTGYNAANNSFLHLSGWTNSNKTSPQNELLYCWGCHSNAGTGQLRNPGALTFTYTNNATATYPDVAGSNVCMACHTGRETGDSIKNDPDADGVRSFLNSHYLAAGGQLFGTTGYEYAGNDYSNPSFFKHDKIGSSAAAGTGSNGPCVGCHMSSANKHFFTNVTKDATGAITAITSTVCASCHSWTPESLTAVEEDYEAAIAAGMAAMASKGIHFGEAHPYWYTAPYVAGGTNTGFTDWASVYGLAKWKDTMGAAFNVNLLAHDPGGFAHNSIYVKRLLWDSIDYITNGTLGDINMTATIDGLAGLTAEQKAAAKAYLGASRP